MPPTHDDAWPAGPVPSLAFAELGLRDELVAVLAELGYEEPTPVQAAAIGPQLAGRDVLAQAATGTGKTAAFALPLLQRLEVGRAATTPMGLVLVPTRELALQVTDALRRYGRTLGARVVAVVGGQPIVAQLRDLERGADVVVATPGRALDHLRRRSLVLDDVAVVVLDEADEMLDLGFADDLDALLHAVPPTRQAVLCSATMPTHTARLADRHLHDPVRLDVAADAPEAGEAPKVRQVAHLVPRSHRAAALGRVLAVESPAAALVFCRTRGEVDELTEWLVARGHRAEALHGGLSQDARDRVMGRLRRGAATLLVATDVAARGLDVPQLTHVINVDVPASPDIYVHRIGRVGRAGREGVAVTLADPRQRRLLDGLGRATGAKLAVEALPTVDDLAARRRARAAEAVQERLRAGAGTEAGARRLLDDLVAGGAEPAEVAVAALAMLAEASRQDGDDDHLPEVPLQDARLPRDRVEGGPRRERPQMPGMAKVFVGAGRHAGIRPGDLVGAIAGEAGLKGGQIGAIQITDRFSLVEVPAESADHVVEVLRRTTLKGRRPTIRRDRATAGPTR